MIDILLKDAMLLWSDEPDSFAVVVDYRGTTRPARFASLDNSRGACDHGWEAMTTPQQLLMLMSVAWSAVVRDRIPIGVLHRALLAIPEYRGWIDHNAPGLEDWGEGS